MDLLTENRPETCASLGLKCGACVRQAAQSVAGVCRGMDPAGVQQIFIQLYPSPFCRPMAHTFAIAYSELAQPAPAILKFVPVSAVAASAASAAA